MNEDTLGRPVCPDHEAYGWAWAQPITYNPGARVVLLCLALRVDEVWECTASQEEIAEDAMLPARSVRRYVDQLEAGGHIRRSKRYDGDGHRLSDLYRLDPARSLLARLDGRQVNPVANLAGRPSDLPANLAGRQVNPPANLASRDSSYRPDWPVVNQDETDASSSEPVAKLAGSQPAYRPIWPVGDPEETDIPRSEPPANLAGREIEDYRSTSPTEKYESKNSSCPKQPAEPKPAAPRPPREDVEQLCARLLQWLIKKDYRQRPSSVPNGWRESARKLLDLDKIPPAEALEVLDWSQKDPFWHQNIHSLAKFREKYGDLEMKSRGLRGGAHVRQLRPTGTDSRFAPNSGSRAPLPTADDIANGQVIL